MTWWYFVYMSALVNVFKDAAGTVCSDAVTDGTAVLNMCADGNVVGGHVVIDTYGSSEYRKDGGSISCSCTATLTGLPEGTFTTVGFGPVQSLYPSSRCGSSVITSAQQAAFPGVSSNTYLCTVRNNTFNHAQTNDTVTVVWRSGVSGSTSGYCLLFGAGTGASLSVKCFHVNDKNEESTTTPPTSPVTVMVTSDEKPSTTTVTSPTTSTLASDGIDATICTDKTYSDGITKVLSMCSGGTLTAGRVVVDTYGTGVYDSCQCTVSLSGTNTGPVSLDIGDYPGTATASGCGSILRFTRHPNNIYTEYQCTQIIGDGVSNFANNELLHITLSKFNKNTQWQSGYCILIESGVNITVTCGSASETPETTTTTTASITTASTPATTTTSTTTPSTTMTTTPADVKSCCLKCDQPTFPLVGVVVPIVVTLLVVAMATVANIILYKRRLTLVNELKSGRHGITLQDTGHYDSLDQSRVEPPNTYEKMSARKTYVNTAMRT